MENREQSHEVASISSVQFAEAVPKFICSKHSGSILAQSEPSVPLTSSNAQRASEVFMEALTLLETSEAGNSRTGCNIISHVMI